MKQLSLLLLSLLLITCENPADASGDENTSWVFVANEGAYGTSNGTISMIDDIGDHKIKIYDITAEGLAMPGIEVSTENSSPREMVVVDGKIYFTNWNTSDVKVFNLYTYNIDVSIPVGPNPEGIITGGSSLWVANSGCSTVHEINISSNSVINEYVVGQGPQSLVKHNGAIYVSRTFYNDDWTIAYHGASKIDGTVTINDYGSGSACGGSVLSHNSDVMRSFDGGLARMDTNLLLHEKSIGDFNQNQIYHVELINENLSLSGQLFIRNLKYPLLHQGSESSSAEHPIN